MERRDSVRGERFPGLEEQRAGDDQRPERLKVARRPPSSGRKKVFIIVFLQYRTASSHITSEGSIRAAGTCGEETVTPASPPLNKSTPGCTTDRKRTRGVCWSEGGVGVGAAQGRGKKGGPLVAIKTLPSHNPSLQHGP
ncbi:unnamed protein product [Pleuronectes platessa]|uniref:Uncharacterized protein n=1 Tax=Pleuronectes platessa TaxID=8262 RepID=A0A9N7UBV6_PLEPL|nr:unnamed protein product [Pleuronectes platessa]